MTWRAARPRSGFPAALVLALLGACDPKHGGNPPPATPTIATKLPRDSASQYRSRTVDELVARASAVVELRGSTADGEPWRGFLVEGGSQSQAISLRSGSCYVIVAAGSVALTELELAVYDADGSRVAEETMRGPRAATRLCPTQTGTYYATVRAPEGSGLFAVRRFQGPTGVAARVDDVFSPVARAPSQGPSNEGVE